MMFARYGALAIVSGSRFGRRIRGLIGLISSLYPNLGGIAVRYASDRGAGKQQDRGTFSQSSHFASSAPNITYSQNQFSSRDVANAKLDKPSSQARYTSQQSANSVRKQTP